MKRYIILFGGNVGDVRDTFIKARVRMQAFGEIILSSSLYECEPWGFGDAPMFLNQVFEFATELEPLDLLDKTQEIEQSLGRREKSKDGFYSSRNIDIDILFCGNLVIESPRLEIPHPLVIDRNFALVPLSEHWADFVHPTMGLTLGQLLDICTDECSAVKLDA